MTKVYNKALQKTITVHRIIGKIQGAVKGPTLVFLQEFTAMKLLVFLL